MSEMQYPMSEERRHALRHIQSMAAEVALQSMIEDILATGSVMLVSSDIQTLNAAAACVREINQRNSHQAW